jgi:hypothetical protein
MHDNDSLDGLRVSKSSLVVDNGMVKTRKCFLLVFFVEKASCLEVAGDFAIMIFRHSC